MYDNYISLKELKNKIKEEVEQSKMPEYPFKSGKPSRATLRRFAHKIADIAVLQDSNFDRQKFLQDCDLEDI